MRCEKTECIADFGSFLNGKRLVGGKQELEVGYQESSGFGEDGKILSRRVTATPRCETADMNGIHCGNSVVAQE